MDQVHVVRQKVLVEGRTQRSVARELGLSRTTVGKYVGQAVPVRKAEAGPRPRPVWEANDLPAGPKYRVYDHPLPVIVEGPLFFDVDHGAGTVGPSGMKPRTAWEIHPITKLRLQ